MSWFSKEEEKGANTGRSNKKYSIREIFGGDLLMETFVTKHFRLILLIVVLILIFISNRYSMTKKIIQIEDLKKELVDVRYDCQITSAKLISKTRPAEISRMLQERGIELTDPVEPAFEIEK